MSVTSISIYDLYRDIGRLEDENTELYEMLLDVDDMLKGSYKLREQLCTQLDNMTESMRRMEEQCSKLRELVQDYDAMLAIAAKNEAATSIILPLDVVLNALCIRAGLLGVEVDE